MAAQLYERVFENARAGLAVGEPGGKRLATVNRAFADALDAGPSELEGRSVTALPGVDAHAVGGAVDRVLDGERETATVVVEDGEARREVTLVLSTVTVEGVQRLLATVGSVDGEHGGAGTDVGEERFEVALSGTDTGVWEWNLGTDEVIWSEGIERLFGLEPGSFEGTFDAFAERVHPEDLPDVQAAIESAVRNDEMYRAEFRMDGDDGERHWVEARGELHDGEEGDGRFIGILTDVSDRRRTARELRQRERQYRDLVERLPDAHYIVDGEWRITICNRALAARLDSTVEELEGTLVWDAFPAERGTDFERQLRRVMETGKPETVEHRTDSGMWVTVQAYPYEDGLAVVSTDISDQRNALLSVIDAAPVVFYRLDGDGVFQEVRGEVLTRLGVDQEDLVDESIFDVYAGNERIVSAAQRALDGDSFRYTTTLDGISLETHYTPVIDDGEVTSVIGVSMDVTELRRQRDRMEFFNSILRHDVLNGMTVIKMRAELLADELEGEHGRHARTILDWCNTTTDVTKRVRQVVETLATADEEHQLEPVDVSAIVERKVGTLRTAYPEVSFRTAVPDGVAVLADDLLEDVLGNLLTNSIEHNDTEGLEIAVEVRRREDAVRVTVTDDGVGIADDRKRAVFRRGSTSHVKETGSGFGLFFVDVMVEKYGGEVRVEDGDAGGARFVLDLSPGETQ